MNTIDPRFRVRIALAENEVPDRLKDHGALTKFFSGLMPSIIEVFQNSDVPRDIKEFAQSLVVLPKPEVAAIRKLFREAVQEVQEAASLKTQLQSEVRLLLAALNREGSFEEVQATIQRIKKCL
jgi:hypothetical protein